MSVSKDIADAAVIALNATSPISTTLADITAGDYNGKSGYDGFYPVVYDENGNCIAHGAETHHRSV